jgi:phage shock protein C
MPKKPAKDEHDPFDLNQLHRSETNRVIAGVAGGLSEYFSIDAALIRLFLVILTIFGGSGIPIYLVLWFIMPTASHTATVEEHIKYNAREMKATAQKFAAHVHNESLGQDTRFWLGILVLLFGIIFLLNNLGLYYIDFGKLWPLFLIIIGIGLLFKR